MATGGRRADPRAEEHGLFSDALADWTNDDVLQTDAARTALGARHPAALRVLDWPELRAQFDRYDPPATRDGRRDRRFGLWSVGLATLGLVLALASPLAVGGERVVEVVAAVLVVAGLAMMAFHRFGAGSRARTLARRFGAERARALYFQAVVNNPDLAARAMTDDAALDDWKAARTRMLGDLPEPGDLPGQIPRLAGPVEDDTEAWVVAGWSQSPRAPEPSKDLDLLLSLLCGQRLDSQIDYVERKLSASLGAPGQRAAVVRMLGRFLLAAAAVTGVMAGVLIFGMGRALGSTDVKLALEVAVGALVAAMALGVTNDDRRLASDADRYAASFTALSRARARFDRGGLAEKLAALRDVEVVCYRDLRAFVGNHWRSR
ncbi:MAG: hypothetical protein JNL41_17370 [Phenylobacterium sp.]|uniref:hypothetical protein n=1 Tax=Phenylobacterium sp. TaxID=1871053 RepID=UPI001A3EC508|nr:hypothetical protein [Phenylobacterium sp.]MBL8556051.1 hypothetical protein [Phenylobacterium sp.]